MNDEIEVSVIVLSYNHEKYIGKCLESILGQEFKERYEIIVHDDASTDRSREIIEEYARQHRDKIITVFQNENKYSTGKYFMALDFAYPKCKGKYIAFCEGDDYWTNKRKLETQYKLMESDQKITAVYHNCDVVDENGVSRDAYYTMYKEKRKCDFRLSDFATTDQLPGQTASLMLRKEILDSLSDVEMQALREIRSNGDMKFGILAGANGRIKIIPEKFSAYRVVLRQGTSWSARHYRRNISGDLFLSSLDIKRYIKYYYGKSYPNDYKLAHSGLAAICKFFKTRNKENEIQMNKVICEYRNRISLAIIILLGHLIVGIPYRIYGTIRSWTMAKRTNQC